MMKLGMLGALISAAVLAGCVSTPQTKALVTPVGAIGYHTFAPPEARRPSPSDIDRMTARLKRDTGQKTDRSENENP